MQFVNVESKFRLGPFLSVSNSNEIRVNCFIEQYLQSYQGLAQVCQTVLQFFFT